MLAHLHDKPPRASLTAGRAAGLRPRAGAGAGQVAGGSLPVGGGLRARGAGRRRGSLGHRGGALGRARRRRADRAPRGPPVVRARGAAADRARPGRRAGAARAGRAGADPHATGPRPRRLWAWASGVVAIAAAAVALAVVPGGADTPQPGEPRLLERGRADGELVRLRLRRRGRGPHLAAADLRRAARRPTDRQTGPRATSSPPTRASSRASAITGFELDGPLGRGRPVRPRHRALHASTYDGRAPTTGQMTWIVISEKGRPRISLIAFRPGP